jgi:hypothetical protein
MAGPALTLWTIVNLFLFVAHPRISERLPLPLAALAIGAALLVVPGVGWAVALAADSRRPGQRLSATVVLSTLGLLAVLAGLQFRDQPPEPTPLWWGTWIVANAGLAVATVVRRPLARRSALTRRETGLASLLFVAAFALYYAAAVAVVPPQVDHDLEVQATGYGLLTRFEPLLLTDRSTIYYFAHPPLLHLYAGASLAYYGRLGQLEAFDQASARARDLREGRAVQAPLGAVVTLGSSRHRVVGIEGGDYLLAREPATEPDPPPVRRPVEEVELARVYQLYAQAPHVLETRTPNLFFAAATVALLGIWARRLSRSTLPALLATLAYATSPEVVVRSSYGGYFAIGAFCCLLMLMAIDGSGSWRQRRIDGAALVAALSDHKMVLLPIAMAAWSAFDAGLRRRVVPICVGFAVGTLIFWSYGLGIAPLAFLTDHLGHHLFDRLRHHNPLGYTGYPSPLALWLEFGRHSGYLLLPVGTLLLAHDVLRPAAGRRRGPATGVWLAWVVLLAAAFTVVDWRMTKHLVPILLPLHLSLVGAAAAPPWRRRLGWALSAWLLLWNIWTLRGLALDFASFDVTPAW